MRNTARKIRVQKSPNTKKQENVKEIFLVFFTSSTNILLNAKRQRDEFLFVSCIYHILLTNALKTHKIDCVFYCCCAFITVSTDCFYTLYKIWKYFHVFFVFVIKHRNFCDFLKFLSDN